MAGPREGGVAKPSRRALENGRRMLQAALTRGLWREEVMSGRKQVHGNPGTQLSTGGWARPIVVKKKEKEKETM